jgi:hypothetical protein
MTKKNVVFQLLLLIVVYSCPLFARAVEFSLASYGKRPQDHGYQYSLLDSVQTVDRVFNNLRDDDRRRTQCFDRAHNWSYDLDQQFHIKNFKVFIFYTKLFREKVDSKWDFHVAPMVASKDSKNPIVLDKTFMEKATPLPEWVNYFSKGKSCLYVNTYPEDYGVDKSNWCYILQVPMYYYGPDSIEAVDVKRGMAPTRWKESEVTTAKSAFGPSRFKRFFTELGF